MNPPKERNIPSGTSPLAGPTLTPKVTPLKVGGRLAEEDQGQEQDEKDAPSAREPRKPGRTRGGRRPAPAVKDAVAHTVRLDPEEATEVDLFVLALRDDARRTRLDKAEVYRELQRLAREDDSVRRKLLRRIKP
ncbi:hypothetical protein ACIOWI_34410 [Streptomyces sp. NPDC087659]|uniref:hypothetical protein n=1 Tax=Streptomyces sp. NPDC087659 TaxID=3365801 RepID=UPI0038237F9E